MAQSWQTHTAAAGEAEGCARGGPCGVCSLAPCGSEEVPPVSDLAGRRPLAACGGRDHESQPQKIRKEAAEPRAERGREERKGRTRPTGPLGPLPQSSGPAADPGLHQASPSPAVGGIHSEDARQVGFDRLHVTGPGRPGSSAWEPRVHLPTTCLQLRPTQAPLPMKCPDPHPGVCSLQVQTHSMLPRLGSPT